MNQQQPTIQDVIAGYVRALSGDWNDDPPVQIGPEPTRSNFPHAKADERREPDRGMVVCDYDKWCYGLVVQAAGDRVSASLLARLSKWRFDKGTVFGFPLGAMKAARWTKPSKRGSPRSYIPSGQFAAPQRVGILAIHACMHFENRLATLIRQEPFVEVGP